MGNQYKYGGKPDARRVKSTSDSIKSTTSLIEISCLQNQSIHEIPNDRDIIDQ